MSGNAVAEVAQAAPARPSAFQRLLRWLRLVMHVLRGLFQVGWVFPRVTPRQRAHRTRVWAKQLLRLLGVRLAPRGEAIGEDARSCFVAANHVSWLDIFVINAVLPARFVAKSEIRSWPVAGWLCDRAGTIFIERARRRDTARINGIIHDVLAEGSAVAIFPEGTTTSGDRLHKFHTALFEPAVVNGADVVPVGIRYLTATGQHSEAAAFTGNTGFLASVAAIVAAGHIRAEVIVMSPVTSAGRDRRELADACETAIASALSLTRATRHHRF